jgi:hypothetical protein
MHHRNLVLSAVALCSAACVTHVVPVRTTPATARVVSVGSGGDTVVLGTGAASIIVKDLPIPIAVVADGYVPVRATISKTNPNGQVVMIPLKTRVVQLTVLPFGATLSVNKIPRSPASGPLFIDEGKQVHIEASMPGFKSIERDYFNLPDKELSPVRETLELVDRVVMVNANDEAASIYADGKLVGQSGHGEVVIGKNACVNVRVDIAGFVPASRQFCQREGVAPPRPVETFVLKERLSHVTAVPATADIMVDSRRVAAGEYPVTIREDDCVQVEISAASYIPDKRQLCNRRNIAPPPADLAIRLEADDSWPLTYQSDQANKDFTVEVGVKRDPDLAWKTLSQVVTTYFDVLETTDKSTGYMRTGWNIRRTPRWTYRTRIIVKLADSNPLKYTVKLVSEQAYGEVKLQDDELFQPRDRILLQYKDLINEVQTRLRQSP